MLSTRSWRRKYSLGFFDSALQSAPSRPPRPHSASDRPVRRQVSAAVGAANPETGKPVERAFENQMREERRRLERVADGVLQAASPLEARVLGRPRRRLRVHEEQHAELFGLRPEGIEAPVRQLLAFDAAADRGAAQSQLADGVVELLGGEIGMLQRDRRHADEPIRMRAAPLGDLLVLQRDEIARERALGRVPPGVDVDRLVVDPLRVHVDQTLRVAKRDVAGEIGLCDRGQWCVLHEVPHLGHEAVGVEIHGTDPSSAEEHLAAAPWLGTHLARRGSSAWHGGACRQEPGGRPGGDLEKVSSVGHATSSGKSRCREAAIIGQQPGLWSRSGRSFSSARRAMLCSQRGLPCAHA